MGGFMIELQRGQILTRRIWLKSSVSLLFASGMVARAAEPAVLRVGFIANYEPFSFLKNDGRLAGFDVDTVEALLASLGMQMQAVTARYGRLRELAKAGQIDMVGNQLLMLAENRSLFEFVRPYAFNSLVCVQHEDDERDFLSLDDFVGRRLGVLRNSGMEAQARGALGPSVVGYDHTDQALAALGKKQIDAVLEESLIVEYLLERDGLPLKVGAPFTAPQKQGLAVVRGNPLLSKKLSESIPTLTRSPEFRKISSRWFGYDVSKPRVSHVTADEL